MRLLFQDSRASGELGDLNLRVSGLLSVALAWMGVLFLPLSLVFPEFLYGVGLALVAALLINLPTYRFFWKTRGLRFALMIIPLHVLYHLYNGASVVGALLYRCLIDRPLPGLKSVGAKLQAQYWHRMNLRREAARRSHLVHEQGRQRKGDNNPDM